MKITELDLQAEGKKYFCKEVDEVFTVKDGNLTTITRSFSMAELLKLDFEEIKETKNPYERVNNRELYYSITRDGRIGFIHEDRLDHDNKMFDVANYFNNRNYAEYVAFKETLMRKIDRFAWEHNAKVVGWDDGSEKYYIAFSNRHNVLTIDWACMYKSNDIYFTSREIAEMALEKFKDDLMKLYTWKFDL